MQELTKMAFVHNVTSEQLRYDAEVQEKKQKVDKILALLDPLDRYWKDLDQIKVKPPVRCVTLYCVPVTALPWCLLV